MSEQSNEMPSMSDSLWGMDDKGRRIATGITALRTRWHMYIDALDERGVGTLVCGVLRFSLDGGEWGGRAKHARVTLLPDKSICVTDDGIGLPFEDTNTPWVRPFTQVNAFAPSSELFVVNAFSDRLIVESAQGGWLWRQEFHGDEWSELDRVGPLGTSGLSVSFWPCALFGVDWDGRVIADRVEAYASRFDAVSVTVVDERFGDRRVLLEYRC